MSVEHYQRIIVLLSEPSLILTGNGRLLALNEPASQLLAPELPEDDDSVLLPSYITSSATAWLDYLRKCCRSRHPVIGAVELRTPGGIRRFTAKGAVLEPRVGDQDAIIMVRLFPQGVTSARFQMLKHRIDELNTEIARRQRAEYDMRMQKRWLEVTLTSIGDAVITTDGENRVRFMNPVAEAMCEWPLEEAVGRPLQEVFVVINEYTREPVENPAEEALREGRVVALANHSVLIARNGTEFSIEDTAAPISMDDEVQGAILVFHDVSGRRILENQLLKRAEKLELANRRKNEFLTMLAHELRSPLSPICNAAEIINLHPDKPPAFDEPHRVIARQVQHLRRLIDDMLDVSRITRGKMNVVRDDVDLADLLRMACSDFEPQFIQAGIQFSLHIQQAPVWVYADPHRMTQVFHNLLGNAMKFTPVGGSVAVVLETVDDVAVVRVEDTGIGIEPGLMSELFEPFTQATQRLDRNMGGLGLGLSLVKGIVDLHEGQVTAESAGMHQGTTITLRLPVSQRKHQTAPSVQTQPALGMQRILIVEDEPDAASTMQQLLEMLGHEVHVANNGPRGLKMAEEIKPDVVLCDIGLPGLDGFAVARKLRETPTTASARLVALTGYGGSEFIEEAHSAGFDSHITKPASLDDIQRKVLRGNSPPPGTRKPE